MCPCQVDVKRVGDPTLTPSLPLFRDGQRSYTRFSDFTDYLKHKVPSMALDMQAEEGKKGELLSFQSLLEEKLYPAYTYAVWMNDANFNTITSRWLWKEVSFPHNLYYAARKRRSGVSFLKSLYPGPLVNDEDIHFATTKQAIQCLNVLSAKLGEKKFFYGDRPTSSDALVFGYLAPLLKLPFPNDRLQVHIKRCPNLVRFVESIIRIYLPLTEEEMRRQREGMEEWERRKMEAQAELRKSRHDAAKEKDEETQDDFKLRDQILFGIGAAVLSVFAALHFGLIKVEVREVDPSDSHTPDLPPDIDFEGLYGFEE